MRNPFTYVTCLLLFVTSSCKDTDQPPQVKQIDTYWTLLPAPNGLDTVGTIFAVDTLGTLTRVPGAALPLHVSNNPIQLPDQSKTKSVSWGAIANFLGEKGLVDGANVSFSDSTSIKATFKITNGELSSFDDDLPKVFDAKSEILAHNIKFLKLEGQMLYIVLETIRSRDLNISLYRTDDMNTKGSINLTKMVDLNPRLSISSESKNELNYKLERPLVVFYHLRPIDVNIIGSKGDKDSKIEVSLGRSDTVQSVLKYHH